MCIICASPIGSAQPTRQQIKTMFNNNPHGAGYMTARNGRVEIHKGFMILDDLLRQLDQEAFTEDDAVVYHFRISTQAGVTPTMTQPFPLTRRVNALEALDVSCSIGVAHNGIIRMTSDGNKRYSDTAIFVHHYLPALIRSPKDLNDPAIITILEELTHSKLALLDKDGNIATVGPFYHLDGLEFSNQSFKTSTFRPVKTGWGHSFTFHDAL